MKKLLILSVLTLVPILLFASDSLSVIQLVRDGDLLVFSEVKIHEDEYEGYSFAVKDLEGNVIYMTENLSPRYTFSNQRITIPLVISPSVESGGDQAFISHIPEYTRLKTVNPNSRIPIKLGEIIIQVSNTGNISSYFEPQVQIDIDGDKIWEEYHSALSNGALEADCANFQYAAQLYYKFYFMLLLRDPRFIRKHQESTQIVSSLCLGPEYSESLFIYSGEYLWLLLE